MFSYCKINSKRVILSIVSVFLLFGCYKKNLQDPSHPFVQYDETTDQVYIPNATIITGGEEYHEKATIKDTSLVLVVTADSSVYFYSPLLGDLDSITLSKSKESLVKYLNSMVEKEGGKPYSNVGINIEDIGNSKYEFTNTKHRWVGIKETKQGSVCVIKARQLFNIDFLNLIKGHWRDIIHINTTNSDTMESVPLDTFQLFGSITRAVFLTHYISLSVYTQAVEAWQADPMLYTRINVADFIDIVFTVVNIILGAPGTNMIGGFLTKAVVETIVSSTHSSMQVAISNSNNADEYAHAVGNSVIKGMLNGVISALTSGKGVDKGNKSVAVAMILWIIKAIVPITDLYVGGFESTFADAYDTYDIENGSGKIIFVSGNSDTLYDNTWEIYMSNSEGGARRQITQNNYKDYNPILTSDYSKIIFVSDEDGDEEIYRMNTDGTGREKLTDNTYKDCKPALSPDGSQIAFVSNRDGNDEIYLMNLSDLSVKRLTNNAAKDWSPTFSPDGSKIAFMSDRDGDWDIYTLNLSDLSIQQLTNDSVDEFSPAYSPDGTKIAFTYIGDGNREIYIMNADGTGWKNLTNNAAEDFDPSFSPDGSKIMFTTNRDGNYELYIMNVDGSGQTNITKSTEDEFDASWYYLNAKKL